MKKNVTLILVVLFTMIALPAQSQLQWGIKGGANVSKVSFNKDLFKSDNMGGFFIGPMAEFTIPIVGLGIDAALLYNQRGVKSEDNNFKQSGLDIPVNLKYTIGLGSMLGVFVAAGPDFFFNFKGDDGIVDKRKALLGVNVGAGVKLLGHLQVGVNYNIPLGKSGEVTVKEGINAVFDKYKTKTWQISAAYLF